MLQKVHIFVARKNNVVIDTLFDMKKKGTFKIGTSFCRPVRRHLFFLPRYTLLTSALHLFSRVLPFLQKRRFLTYL